VDNTSDATKNAATATLTNKTLTGNIAVNLVSGAATVTLPTTTGTLATLANAETLSNKTLAAPAITGAIDVLQSSAPASPAASHLAVYVSSVDGKVHTKDSAGTDSVLGASGSGELNMVANPSDVVGWLNANNSSTLVTTTTAGDLPLSAIIPTALKLTSGTSVRTEATLADTFSYAFTTPASYAVKTKIEFWLRTGTLFLGNEWTVSVYAGAVRQALTTDASSITYLPNANGKFTTYFDAVASTAYTVRFTRTVNAGTNAAVLNVANVIVGPGIQPQGAVVGPWIAFTPTLTNWVQLSGQSYYRRAGDSVEVQFYVRVSGTPTGELQMNLPASLTVNTAIVSNTNAVGVVRAQDGAGTNFTVGTVVQDVNAAGRVRFIGTDAGGNNWDATHPFTVNNASQFSGHYTMPVNEWAGSGTVNLAQNDVEYVSNSSTSDANDTTSFAYGPSGSQFANFSGERSRVVRFKTPIQATDQVVIEITTNNGVSWQALGTSDIIQSYSKQNTTQYGVILSPTTSSTTDVTIYFEAYRLTGGATFGAAGTDWSAIDADNTYRWRVKKSSGGQAVGFGAFQAASSTNPAGISGLVPALGLPGRTDGVAVAAGYVGEIITGTLAYGSGTALSTGVTKTITSVALTPGVWDLAASAGVQEGGITSTEFVVSYSPTTNATPAASQIGISRFSANYTFVSTNQCLHTLPRYRVNISASATYYLTILMTFSAGSPLAIGTVTAVRIA
jgi:hypothetical protein